MTRPALVWVVGAGGLLGQAVKRELGANGMCFSGALAWHDGALLREQLEQGIHELAGRVALEAGRAWAVAWCAGAGVVATSPAALAAETQTFRGFLSALGSDPRLRDRPGNVLLASSAGGVYGSSWVCPIDESTPPAPGSPYGHAKLEQEAALDAWARGRPQTSTLVARIANLYGPGQRLSKPQGLISHMSRCLIFDSPVHIYVSLDTIRDYLFADDAGRLMVNDLRRLEALSQAEPLHVTKIYASEREVSIAGLLGVFRSISRRKLRVVSGLHAASALQPRRLQFRSRVWASESGRKVELVEGVSRVYRHQLALFRQGRLPPPPLVSSRR